MGAKELDELKRLKEKQVKRKAQRVEEEKKLAEQKREEEMRRQREIEEKKQREIDEKRRRLEETEKKKGGDHSDDPAAEFKKTKEQLAEEKKVALSIRIQPLDVDNLSEFKLRAKAEELWVEIVKLETEKYDLEQRSKRQDYDLKELIGRQKVQLRNKALKRGLDPEALTGKHPPKIRMASKFERSKEL